MLVIAKRIIKQIFNDKRSLMLIFFVPLMMFTLLFLLLGPTDYKAKISENKIPKPIIQQMKDNGVDITSTSKADGIAKVKSGKTDALFYLDKTQFKLLMQTNDSVKTGVITKDIQDAIKSLQSGAAVKIEFIYGKSLGLLSYIMPVYYACDGLEKVLIKGGGPGDLWTNDLALVIFIVVFSFLNIQALRKYRRI